MHCKSYSHFFSKKFQHICVSLDVKFNESLTNDVVSFEQLGPGDFFFLLCWGLKTSQPMWVILCHLPEKGRKEIEEIVEEMKERDREERGTGMKVKKQKK